MKKQNMPLAMEILRKEQRCTWFWRIAFLVVLVAAIVKSIAERQGIGND